jgi:hypothetical protein
MSIYEAVCDRCMETQTLWTDHLENRDCPICGVGKLLGPWPVRPRFESQMDWGDLAFPLGVEEEVAERE